MAVEVRQETSPRTPLVRERILTAAVGVADEGGIKALTMRGLGHVLVVLGEETAQPLDTPMRSSEDAPSAEMEHEVCGEDRSEMIHVVGVRSFEELAHQVGTVAQSQSSK
jgi:hypothetical protein